MNLKRLFLVFVAAFVFVYCAFSIGTILVSRGNENLYIGESNSKMPGTSSEIFSKRYSTSHAPCYGTLNGQRPNGFSLSGPTP